MAEIGRPIKFVIRLTPEERTRLEGMIHCGIGALNSALKARILLKTDVSENGPGWSDERIAEALETSLSTVLRTRRQFVEEGLDVALSRKKSFWSPPRTFDGEAEAKLIALTCSEPPKGHTHWTRGCWKSVWWNWELLRRPVTPQSIGCSKKTKLNRIEKYWVIPSEASAEFVAAMRATLEVYTRPHDPTRPPVFLDCQNIKAIDPRDAPRLYRMARSARCGSTTSMNAQVPPTCSCTLHRWC